MTLFKFQKLLESKGWKQFVYFSENQEGRSCTEPVKATLTFTQMVVHLNPNAVFLMRESTYGKDWLRLDFVSSVTCRETVLGDTLKIRCDDCNGLIPGVVQKRITIIAR